jgi:SpoVK/Ycf46/Vps4 family AAA+-type ATPase
MANANDVYALAQSALQGNVPRTHALCRVIANKEKENSSLKERMNKLVQTHSPLTSVPDNIKNLVTVSGSNMGIDDLTLSESVKSKLNEFLLDQTHSQVLSELNLPASSKVMLSGPPGNGKTSLAGAIAKHLELPLYTVDFSETISSFLGDTGKKIAQSLRELSKFPCVIFLDEIETVLPERSGRKQVIENGEIARIVSTLILEIDRLPIHTILIGATNHPDLLDKAVARRFDTHIVVDKPTKEQSIAWLNQFALNHPKIPVLELGIDFNELSYSELEKRALTASKTWAIKHLLTKKGL